MSEDDAPCKDIARQLIEDNRKINVILGGGRQYLLPDTETDPETNKVESNQREDGKNLIEVLQKLVELESQQTNLQEEINNQETLIISQQAIIDGLQQSLTDTSASQWSDWATWGGCFTSCTGNDGGRIQTRSRQAVVGGMAKHEQESRPCNAVQFRGCVQTPGVNDNFAVAHNFADQMAQSTCTAILSGNNHVFAVRRQCSASTSSCETICSSLGKTCFNSLHVYDVAALERDDTGSLGLRMYKYNNCGGGCGPNFCCCSGA